MFNLSEQVQQLMDHNEHALLAATIDKAQLSNVDYNGLLNKSHDDLHTILEETNHHLEIESELSGEFPTLHGVLFNLNKDKITQVLRLDLEPHESESGYGFKVGIRALNNESLEEINTDSQIKAVCEELRQAKKEEH